MKKQFTRLKVINCNIAAIHLTIITILSVLSCKQEEKPTSKQDSFFISIADSACRLLHEGKTEQGINYIDSVYSKVNNISPFGRLLRYRVYMRKYNEVEQYDNALDYNDSMLGIMANELAGKHFDIYITALIDRGDILYQLGNFSLAAEYFLKAKSESEQSGYDVSNTLNHHIGMALYGQGKYMDAAQYFIRAYVSINGETILVVHIRQQLLNNIAMCYEKTRHPDKALYYYDSAISYVNAHAEILADTVRAEVYKAVIYGNMGTVYLSQGIDDTAEILYKKSIEVNSRKGNIIYENRDAMLTKVKLARLYLYGKRYTELKGLLEELHKDLEQIPAKEIERDWNQLMYQYYDYAGKPLTAYNYYKNFISIRDSLSAANKGRNENDMRKELTLKEQEYRIGLLEKDNNIRTLFLIISIAVGLMAIIVGLLVYSGFRRSKRQNILINTQKAALEKSNKEKERILQVVAHDLRNPVGSIAYLADMQMMDDGSSMPVSDSFVMIKDASSSALGLINELLGYDDEGINDATKEKMSVGKLVCECAKLLEFKAMEKEQTIVTELTVTDVTLFINREKMIRVLSNLISNAIKFSPIGATIIISTEKHEDKILITVKDWGIGIPKNIQGGLFEIFSPNVRSGTAGEKSYGLGLSICKQITEAHGGKIWFESEEGKGSMFYIELPVVS